MASKKASDYSPGDGLALWTRRFSVMIGQGVSLMSALQALADEETTGGLREITGAMMDRIGRGETLSETLRAWPEVFDEDHIGSARAGEIGGVLDATMRRMAERMERGLVVPAGLAADQVSRAETAEWCWRFGHMLSAGVPLLVALETLSESGHPVLREISRRMRDEASAGSSLALADSELGPGAPRPVLHRFSGIFGPVVRRLLVVGVNNGSLDVMLKQAAELLDHEAALEAAGQLPPLSAQAAEDEEGPEAPEEERPVIRRVNAALISAFRVEAEGIELHATEDDKGEAVVMKEGGAVETIALDDYGRAVRRVRIMAGIDPFSREQRNGTIYVRHEGKEYEVHVRSFPEPLWLRIRRDAGAVEL